MNRITLVPGCTKDELCRAMGRITVESYLQDLYKGLQACCSSAERLQTFYRLRFKFNNEISEFQTAAILKQIAAPVELRFFKAIIDRGVLTGELSPWPYFLSNQLFNILKIK